MGPLFPRWTNTFFRLVLVMALATPAAAIAALMLYVRSPLITRTGVLVDQPVQFDHRHHTSDVGIDCRYCHFSAETSAFAGIPDTGTCMGCHAQVWNKSPKLALVRQAYFTQTPLRWNRVHLVPDFVYFDHSIHLAKGVGCASCHGRVDQMAVVQKTAPLTMQWCLECHRNPSAHLRPLDQITQMAWQPREGLLSTHDVRTRDSCTTCHR
ncbi:MAG: cytochrome c3 family protein [Myxococcota bacterium]